MGSGRSVVDGPSPLENGWRFAGLSAEQVLARRELFAALRRRERAAVLAARVRRSRRAAVLADRVRAAAVSDPVLDDHRVRPRRRVVPLGRVPAANYSAGMVGYLIAQGVVFDRPKITDRRAAVPRSTTAAAGSSPDRSSFAWLWRF